MNLLQRSLYALRTWLGLGEASDDRLTPSHGWLLPVPEVVAERRTDGAPAPAGTPLR